MAWVRHGTLVANSVTTVSVPDLGFGSIEILNRDTTAEIYFLFNKTGVTTDPTVGGNDCEVVVALSALTVDAPQGAFTVKLLSAGTPKYSVRAE